MSCCMEWLVRGVNWQGIEEKGSPRVELDSGEDCSTYEEAIKLYVLD